MKRTLGLAALAVVVGVPLVAVVLNAVTGGQLALRAKFDTVRWVTQRSQIVEFAIPGAGQFEMFLNPADRVITPLLQAHRVWEPEETRLFLENLRPGDTVVDVGANVGYYTVLASQIVGPKGRVFAFEPDPVGFALLQDNVALAGATNVIAEQKALSDKPGSIQLFLADENKGDHRIFEAEGEKRQTIDIEAVAFDDYIAAHGGGPVHFIKIDTQGAEAVILQGMKKTLSAPENADIRLIIEFWPGGLAEFGASAKEMLAGLSAADFRFLELPPTRFAHLPPTVRTAEQLLAAYPVAKKNFTSLLLMKGAGAHKKLTDAIDDAAALQPPDPAALAAATAALKAFNEESIKPR